MDGSGGIGFTTPFGRIGRCCQVSRALVCPSNGRAMRMTTSTGRRGTSEKEGDAAILPQTKDIPKWAGGGVLSELVNFLIGIEPLFKLMQRAARNVLISTAEEKGVLWRDEVLRLSAEIPISDREALLEKYTDEKLEYPWYYLQKFHGYDQGNLNWQAAFEVQVATTSMALRVWKDESLTGETAYKRLRTSHLDTVQRNAPVLSNPRHHFIAVDAGCGCGLSSVAVLERLRRIVPEARIDVLGLDASPYFLAVADRCHSDAAIVYKHALAEDTKLPDDSVHWFGLQYVVHEVPASVIARIFEEAYRVLQSGGVLSFVDNNPQSKTIQNLPPALFTLMKSTEPHTDSYYRLDIVELLRRIGFIEVVSEPSDHRHRTVVAVKA